MKVVIAEGTTLAGPMGSAQSGDVLSVAEEFGQALIKSGSATAYVEPDVAAAAAPLATGLMSQTIKQLGAIAEASGIALSSRMTKPQIVEALVAGGIPDGDADEADPEAETAEETPPAEQATSPADGEENAAERTGQPDRTRTPTED